MTKYGTVEPRDGDKGYLVIPCQHTPIGHCLFPVWQRPAQGTMWNWDGNVEEPTISPSIDCHGGCRRHFVMTKGHPSDHFPYGAPPSEPQSNQPAATPATGGNKP